MSGHGFDCRKRGFVSVWVGTFPSVEAAEAYFGIPDEIGVYLPPESFARDLGLEDLPPECLEVNFEQLAPRPVRELLRDASFSASFIGPAVRAAEEQGIPAAQGIALLFDLDYRALPDWQPEAGPLRFLGSFPFAGAPAEESEPRRDPRIETREITDDLL